MEFYLLTIYLNLKNMIIKKLKKHKKEIEKLYFKSYVIKNYFHGYTKILYSNFESIFNSKHKILHVYTQSPKKKSWAKENHIPFHDYAIEKNNKNKISKNT